MSTYESRNPKPTSKVGLDRRNPKPETDIRHMTLVSAYETRNPKPTSDIWRWFRPTKPETRNPKPETDIWSWFRPTKPETRNPKPTSDIWRWFRPTKPETRNRHLNLVSTSETRNPKPENDSNPTFEVALRIGTPSCSKSPNSTFESQYLPVFAYFHRPAPFWEGDRSKSWVCRNTRSNGNIAYPSIYLYIHLLSIYLYIQLPS